MDIDGSDVKQITFELGYDGGAFFSPDGSKLAVSKDTVSTKDDSIRLININELTILEETITGSYTWSVNQILQDISKPMFWAVILWVVLAVVRSLRERQTSGSKYWGI